MEKDQVNMAQDIHQLLLQQKMDLNPDAEKDEFILTDEDKRLLRINTIESICKHLLHKYGPLAEEKIKAIEWEKYDFTSAYEYGNSCAHSVRWHQQRNASRKDEEISERKKMAELYNSEYMFNLMAYNSFHSFDKKLIFDENTSRLIRTICYFLSEDSRFESLLGYSFKKGLWLLGEKGLGKTHVALCTADNPLNPIFIESMLTITDDIRAYGTYKFNTSRNKIYLDDVGSEEPLVNYYGSKVSFFKNFIETRYLNQKTYSNLIVSTNEDFNSIEEKYGGRVRSRIKDMFNVIKITGADMRGSN